jgi:uncharacterized RDD family membrane protein YckC
MLIAHTRVKNPHTLVASRTTAEIMKNGRLPQMFAPAAVKNVVKPIQKARKPIMRLDAISMLTLYFIAMSGRPGVTIGPRLMWIQHVNMGVRFVGLTLLLHRS